MIDVNSPPGPQNKPHRNKMGFFNNWSSHESAVTAWRLLFSDALLPHCRHHVEVYVMVERFSDKRRCCVGCSGNNVRKVARIL